MLKSNKDIDDEIFWRLLYKLNLRTLFFWMLNLYDEATDSFYKMAFLEVNYCYSKIVTKFS